jgi:hypothetical protein
MINYDYLYEWLEEIKRNSDNLSNNEQLGYF